MKPGDTHVPIDPGVTIGHVHLNVADFERARSHSTAACWDSN